MNGAAGEFVRPDYSGGGLLNLMASFAAATGAPVRHPRLDPCFGLEAGVLAGRRRIVLVVIDGLGDHLLDPSITPTLCRHRRGVLSSVFPSTTASAMTTLLTGLAPAEHGLTGWHLWFAEIDTLLAALPLTPRGPHAADWDPAPLPSRLFTHRPFSAETGRRHLTLSPQYIVDSPFNRYHSQNSQRVAYRSAAEFFPRLATLLRDEGRDRPCYVHAYLPDLDELLHAVGPGHDAVGDLLAWIDWGFSVFLERVDDGETAVVLTADHGFIEAPDAHRIELDAHPALAAMLCRPLCGESRVAFAYLKPGKHEAFAEYVDRHLAAAVERVDSREFIAAGWFGPVAPPFAAHPRLASRCGDQVLLMRGDWTIKDWMPGERRYRLRGVHAGASPAEMRVPLIVAGV